jgi:disulfide bond formation protein DsbB
MSVNGEPINAASQEGFLSSESEKPAYKLYSVGGVAIATFFASVFMGGIFMAINYKRLGNKVAAWKTLGFSFLALVANLVIADLLPANVPPMVLSLPFLLAMGQAMSQLQGRLLAEHVHNQGQLESKWKAFGIAFIVVLAVGALLYVLFILSFSLLNPELSSQ